MVVAPFQQVEGMQRVALSVTLGIAVVLVASAGLATLTAQDAVDAAFEVYFSADDPSAAERAARDVLASGVGFDTALARLKTGRRYERRSTGIQQLPTRVNGTSLDNMVDVPDDYDPSRPWALQVQLHGGVGRQPPGPGDSARPLRNRIPGASQLYLHPRAWANSQWWTPKQVDNILSLVDQVKRTYNVDESRVYITGISDGGTGVYYLAMRSPSLWASCLPLNGHPMVLANPSTGVDGELFLGNLANCPLYLVNGGRDRLYPASGVAPFVDLMREAGASPVFQVYPDAGHDTSWWPTEQARYEAFVEAHARLAHPEQLSWETERTDRYNRVAWLVIDRLGRRETDRPLEDVNSFELSNGRRVQMYQRSGRSGRVDVARTGNTFEASTRGVERFTLLLSPDAVAFDKPVQVLVNGRTVFNGTVAEDTETLLKWAARDDDRTRLYGAELAISVP